MLSHQSQHRATWAARPEIEALSLLETDAQIIGSLRQLAATFGKVASVSALPQTGAGPLFLVHFEDAGNAVRAANSLRCPLFGYSTLIVPVARRNLAANHAAEPAMAN